MNKSSITNLIAILIIIAGYFSPDYNSHIKSIGYYALSGALTNWLAIYMLFEKVPLLYGSGVIPSRFEDFKKAIKGLIMTQFFTPENLKRFLKEEKRDMDGVNLSGLISAIDYEFMFNGLVDVILNSPFGGMLGMFGGVQALAPLREPFEIKMKEMIINLSQSEAFLEALTSNTGPLNINDTLINRIEHIVESRLNELTPQIVKEIIQEMIRAHLGWLVIWGGVFGGLIGLAMSFIA